MDADRLPARQTGAADHLTSPGTGENAAQPRPALGRRPWLALLRRARNLRRFAFAMGGRLPDRTGGEPAVRFVSPRDGWSSPPVLVALTHLSRWRGLRPAPFGWGLALRSSSVHGKGMVEALRIVAMTPDFEVAAVAELPAGRFLQFPRAVWLLEIPSTWPSPRIGARLEARPILGAWPAS